MPRIVRRSSPELAGGCACLVALVEVAGELGVPIETVRGYIAPDEFERDWRGVESVHPVVAGRVLVDYRTSRERDRFDREGFEDYVADLRGRRESLATEAALKAHDEVLARHAEWSVVGPTGPLPGARRLAVASPDVQRAAAEAARAAADDARQEFDGRERELSFEAWQRRESRVAA